MTRLLAGAALAALIAPAATAQDDPPAADTVLATVEGVDITLGHLITLQTMLPDQYRQLPDEVLVEGLVEQLIQQQVIASASDPADMRPIDELVFENEMRSVMARVFVDRLSAQAVTEQMVQAEYDAIYGDAGGATEWNASHILVETRDAAEEIAGLLEDGGDFADLAAERSIGPSGEDGGQLGWFGPGQMVGPFETAIADLEVGEVSGPVETRFGWHVLQLNDIREQQPPSLEEVRAQIEQALSEELLDQRIADLTEAAEIERAPLDFDPSVIRNTDVIPE